MKLTIVVTVLVLIILREIVAVLLRWGNGEGSNEITLFERLANLNDKWFHWHERRIEEVTIGWRKSEDQHERVNGDGVIEYYRRIR